MKIHEDSPNGDSVSNSDAMERKFTKPSEVIDACMDVLREEGRGNERPMLPIEIGELPLSSSIGEFDVELMQSSYHHCDREGNSESTARSSVGVDPNADNSFASEIMSGMNESNPCTIGDAISPPRWQRQHRESRGENINIECDVLIEPREQSDFTGRRYSQNISRTGRRFLSSETMDSSSTTSTRYSCVLHKHRDRSSSLVDRDIVGARREKSAVFSTSLEPSDAYESGRRTLGDNKSPTFERTFKSSASSGVLGEIDMAVSIAQSRFRNINIPSLDICSNSTSPKSSAPNYFSSCQLNVPQGNISSFEVSADKKATSQRVDTSPPMTKNYASQKSSACLLEDEWKRKSEYGSADPTVHEASFGQSSDIEPLVYSANVDKIFSSQANINNRNFRTTEKVRSESASSQASRLPVETKINPAHDERNIATYNVGASLHAQSLTHKGCWPQSKAHEKQGIGRSNEKDFECELFSDPHSCTPEDDNKPVNLCLLQGKRDYQLGQKHIPSSSTKDFRKYTKTFSIRQKPYQQSKRRTKSQCSVSPISQGIDQIFDLGYNRDRQDWSKRVNICDMGVENRTTGEAYNKEPSTGVYRQRSTADSNLSPLFSTGGTSHMMVQDEAKTYAILSGRHSEDIMNPHSLPSSVSPQQQSMYQQSRHSHSIINYAGPQGQSPDLRAPEMSPSPPVRDHRATPSSSLPGILPSSKVFSNVIVGRQQQHSISPSRREEYGQDSFQRQYESASNLFESFQPHHSLALSHHAGSSSFAPLHISQQEHQQASPFLIKHHKKDYFDNSHSSSMMAYGGSLQMSQHQGYLKPPPVDLDDLSDEERERMRVKRERNRVAAAKCRNRRRELLERLEKEAEQLEREQELLRENVRRLRVQKLQLGNMLEEHEPSCQKTIDEEIKSTSDNKNITDEQHKSAASGGLDASESSSSKNLSSPPQVTTQA